MATISDSASGRFKILYFATASSYTKKESELLPAPLPLGKLFETLEERYNGITERVLDSCLVAVNLEYVDMPSAADGEDRKSEVVIKEGDEVALIPPVSSG